jgi:putative PIN family toxin of toxin-antitoxin system
MRLILDTNVLVRIKEFIEPKTEITECRDPKDNKFLELAIAGNAECIVTGDKDLLELNPFRNIQIITPKEFLDRFYI